MSLVSFSPSTSVTVAVSTTPLEVTVLGRGHYLRLVNGGTGQCYVVFFEPSAGLPPAINPTTAMLVPSGAIEIFSCASDFTRLMTMGDATGTTLNVTRGEGQ